LGEDGGGLGFFLQGRRELQDFSLALLLRQAWAVERQRGLVAAIHLYVCPDDRPISDVCIALRLVQMALGSIREGRRGRPGPPSSSLTRQSRTYDESGACQASWA